MLLAILARGFASPSTLTERATMPNYARVESSPSTPVVVAPRVWRCECDCGCNETFPVKTGMRCKWCDEGLCNYSPSAIYEKYCVDCREGCDDSCPHY